MQVLLEGTAQVDERRTVPWEGLARRVGLDADEWPGGNTPSGYIAKNENLTDPVTTGSAGTYGASRL